MANGQPGKKLAEKTRDRALELLKTLTVDQVARRLSVSKSAIRNWQRAAKEANANG